MILKWLFLFIFLNFIVIIVISVIIVDIDINIIIGAYCCIYLFSSFFRSNKLLVQPKKGESQKEGMCWFRCDHAPNLWERF